MAAPLGASRFTNLCMTAPDTATDSTADSTEHQRQQALGWFVRRRDASWRAQDESAFAAWLAADPRHPDLYAQCDTRWQHLDDMPADLIAGLRQQTAHDQAQRLRESTQQNNARADHQATSRRRFMAWPAALSLAAVASAGGYVAWQQLGNQPVYLQAFETARGQQQSTRLSDGSQIDLDTATKLEVRFYDDRREVRLQEGQALFRVAHDGRPFHVLAGSVRTTVVGTRFSVRYTPALAGNDAVQIAVEEGQVRVAPLARSDIEDGRYDLQAGTLLSAGQQMAMDAQGQTSPMTKVAQGDVAAWREQRLSFVDVPLAQALAELERYHPTGLRILDPQVAALRLSGTFDPMATAALHKALPRVLPLRLRTHDGFVDLEMAR